jgi:hypothetical protein
MRYLTTLSLAVFISIGPGAGASQASTTKEQLIELMRYGLGDDVLIALIQTDGSTFQLSAPDILSLHRQGLSDKVIRAMLGTAKKPHETAKPPSLPVDQPVSEAPLERQAVHVEQVVQPAVPAVVNVYQTVTQRVEPSAMQPSVSFVSVPVAVPVFVRTPVVPQPAPVYWGWGGQRRPDSWDDGNRPANSKDAKTPDKNKGGR